MNLIQKAIKKAKDFIAEENIERALKQGCFENAFINFRTTNRIKEGFEYLDKFEKYVKEDRKE